MQWQEWSAPIGRVVPAVGIWSPCRIRGCERRRAPAPRSGDALDCRRQSGAEQRGFAESDGALRDAMARGAREPLCYCRFVRPMDRPCARSPPAEKHRARHGFKREPDPRRAGDERLERPLRQLHALAYNLGNFLRTLATPEPIKDWSLTTLKDKLIKIGAKVVSHGRYVIFRMAEVAIPRQMFQEILRLIAELRPQPPPASA